MKSISAVIISAHHLSYYQTPETTILFQIDGYLSPVTKENTIARKTTRFRTFPDHLLIQLKKFDIDEKWQPYKVLGIIIGVINYHLSQTIQFYGIDQYNQNLKFQLDVEVDMPDNIDLACLLKSTGKCLIKIFCSILDKLFIF